MTDRWLRVHVSGPLAPYVRTFVEDLTAQGYAERTVVAQVRMVADLSEWLDYRHLTVLDLVLSRIDDFLRERHEAGHAHPHAQRGLEPFLSSLRHADAIPPSPPARPATTGERLLTGYAQYLMRKRGLLPYTAGRYQTMARRFLSGRHELETDLQNLRASDISEYVLSQCGWQSVPTVKSVTTSLRSFLHYLYLTGGISTRLKHAVPAVGGRRADFLPRGVPAGQVAALLDSCDRKTTTGRRDYAILTLLSRLGLRCGEVAGLELEDFDWRHGVVTVRGKGRSREPLPLPIDVGEALADYLEHGRPIVATRKLFIRVHAPLGALHKNAVQQVVRSACRRSGQPEIGPHRLRYTLGTAMLNAGASLSEIGQVLRHRSPESTAIYAKVDRTALRALARPWPGGVS